MINLNPQNDLYNALKAYSQTDAYPLHMPGHKRNTDLLGVSLPFAIDITEIDGFDNLHSADGILKAAAQKAEKLFHSEHSYMLINGSTCGILAAIYSTAKYNNTIIIARNCHKSVYNACLLNHLEISFIFTEQDEKSGICSSVTPENVKEAIEACPNAAAVVITSPTYEGVISDIKSIAEIAHQYKIPLIVDNAHGTHQRFCSFCKGEPVSSGADIVISSLHKTLPSLTQTAVAHVNGDIVSHRKFENALSIFETSSPSYVLMSSIDRCFDFLSESRELFEQYENMLRLFSEKMKKLNHLKILCHGSDTLSEHSFYSFDFGKIVICTSGTNLSGAELMNILREKYHLELEMSYPFYVVAMTSVCDTDEGIERLAAALLEIDKRTKFDKTKVPVIKIPKPEKSELSIHEALELSDADAKRMKISNSFKYAYPPGVPIVIPGERTDSEIGEYLSKLNIV